MPLKAYKYNKCKKVGILKCDVINEKYMDKRYTQLIRMFDLA